MFFQAAAVVLALAVPVVYGAGSAFNYNPDDPNGPLKWQDLAIDDNACGANENSPIAITDSGCTDYADYILRGGSCTYEDMVFTINDHGVKAEFGTDCEKPNLEMPNREGVFDALQFHIHTGSEHTVNGITFGAEMHIVHQRRGNCPKSANGRCFAVVGTKLNPASNVDNRLFHFFLEGWIRVHNDKERECMGDEGSFLDYPQMIDDTTLIDPYLFNRNSRMFHYQGGLTTPPCSEVVWWNLDDEALAISPEQFSFLGRIILGYRNDDCEKATVAHHGVTSRPTQPLNGRTVQKICPKAYAPEVKEEEEEDESSACTAASVVGALGAAANVVGQLL